MITLPRTFTPEKKRKYGILNNKGANLEIRTMRCLFGDTSLPGIFYNMM